MHVGEALDRDEAAERLVVQVDEVGDRDVLIAADGSDVLVRRSRQLRATPAAWRHGCRGAVGLLLPKCGAGLSEEMLFWSSLANGQRGGTGDSYCGIRYQHR